MQTAPMHIGCVLMAAGDSKRFGENKLQAELDGKSLICRAMDAVPFNELYRAVLVTQYPVIAEQGKQRGFVICLNDQPALGLSHTVYLGVEALRDADALLFLVADQPLLKRESVVQALRLYRENPHRIIAMGHAQRRGNPCIFPRAYFPELMALTGDHGGRSVIERHEDALLLCELQNERELMDVDTQDALQGIKRQA